MLRRAARRRNDAVAAALLAAGRIFSVNAVLPATPGSIGARTRIAAAKSFSGGQPKRLRSPRRWLLSELRTTRTTLGSVDSSSGLGSKNIRHDDARLGLSRRFVNGLPAP